MSVKLNIIVAVCENRGIGVNGTLPWKLKKEMAYFTRMTTATKDPSKNNAVIMGRKTWESIPSKFKPLSNRLNLVISSTLSEPSENVLFLKSLDEAVKTLSSPAYSKSIEKVWVIGGSSVYKSSLESPSCFRVYLTEIRKLFNCDTFFPEIPRRFKLVKDQDVPDDTQEENGIEYVFKVYEAADE